MNANSGRANRRILIVDDTTSIHQDFRKILCADADGEPSLDTLEQTLFGTTTVARQAFILDSAYQGQEALDLVNRALAANAPYAMAFIDMRMPPGWDGLQTIEQLWNVDPNLQIALCTAYSDYSFEAIEARLKYNDQLLILKKPFDHLEIRQMASALTWKWQLAQDAALKVIGLERTIEERVQELLKVSHLLQYDALTELPNSTLQGLRRNIQFIFQDPFASLDPRVTVGFSIMEPLLVHKIAQGSEAQARVAWLLEKVGLSAEHAQRYPHEFSGGQRQRIAIARALALNPQVVIADEAVSALDVSIQAQIVNLMLDLQRELGIAYLFISHDMAVVERVSHRVAVMYLGQIVEIGPRRAIFENPQHPYTRKLMAAVPVADPTRRNRERPLLSDEIPSPVRAVGDEPQLAPLVKVGPDHFVAQHRISHLY